MISNNQTTFVKGRSIMELFAVAREYLNYCHKMKIPSILYKVDFAKAFDTVDWCFLTNLLIERGFPPRWLAAVLNILKSSSSTIKVNGTLTPSFSHRRGLRQGDPLSPMLFILLTDSLKWFINNSIQLMHSPMVVPPQTIQYADDTIISTEAHPTSLKILAKIIENFGDLMGLRINLSKSNFVPIAIPNRLIGVIERLLSARSTTLPITYLGLLLSIRQLRKVDFQLLIEAVQNRLASWQSSFLSYGGRLTLVKAVLTALPLHYMQVIKIPKGVIKHIDRARRQFLWKGNQICRGIICLVDWKTVCGLKENGGLGILELTIQNNALLTKWL